MLVNRRKIKLLLRHNKKHLLQLEEQLHHQLVTLDNIAKHLLAQWEDSKERHQWQQMLVLEERSNAQICSPFQLQLV
jgi:hypothetical protein